jgi:hypothetical protein
LFILESSEAREQKKKPAVARNGVFGPNGSRFPDLGQDRSAAGAFQIGRPAPELLAYFQKSAARLRDAAAESVHRAAKQTLFSTAYFWPSACVF